MGCGGLGGLTVVVLGLDVMPVREVGVVTRLVVVSGRVVLGGLVVMLGRMLVMLGGVSVMFCGVVCGFHEVLPLVSLCTAEAAMPVL